jgi:hypothetical protein
MVLTTEFKSKILIINCSNQQGSILSKATRQLRSSLPGAKWALAKEGGGSNAYCHSLRLRLNHLTGDVMAGLAVIEKISNTDCSNMIATKSILQNLGRATNGTLL